LELVSAHVAAARQDVGFGRAGVGFICRDDWQSHHRQKQEPGTPHVLRHPSATFCNTQRFVTEFTFVVCCLLFVGWLFFITYFMTFSNAEAISRDDCRRWGRRAVAQLVEALHYKPEGRGFDSSWCHWKFSLT
jgi:hypothetical protein